MRRFGLGPVEALLADGGVLPIGDMLATAETTLEPPAKEEGNIIRKCRMES